MKTLDRLVHLSVPAAFTIEASMILPIVFVITVWFITTSFTIHDRIKTFSEEIFTTIKNVPAADSSEGNDPLSDRINITGLNGRKVLLKYKLIAEGLRSLTGGMDDED